MNAAIIWDEAYAEHDTGSRPEGADRISTMVDHLRATDLWPGLTVVKPEAATEDDILLVHTRRHLAMIKRAGQGGGRVAIIDWDVQHGNVTPAAFFVEPRVLFLSMHQWPHYPGSGFFT